MAKAAGSQRSGRVRGGASDLADLDAEFGLSGGSSNRASAGIAPSGRAPRGQGKEFADRRAIANRIDTLQDRISNLQSSVSANRGQRRQQFNLTRNRTVLSGLRQTLSASVSIANGPGDWSFKRELINDLINSQQGA